MITCDVSRIVIILCYLVIRVIQPSNEQVVSCGYMQGRVAS